MENEGQCTGNLVLGVCQILSSSGDAEGIRARKTPCPSVLTDLWLWQSEASTALGYKYLVFLCWPQCQEEAASQPPCCPLSSEAGEPSVGQSTTWPCGLVQCPGARPRKETQTVPRLEAGQGGSQASGKPFRKSKSTLYKVEAQQQKAR